METKSETEIQVKKQKRSYWLTDEAAELLQLLASNSGIGTGAFLEVWIREEAAKRLPGKKRIEMRERTRDDPTRNNASV